MAQNLSDNLLCRAPKQLDDRCGVFASGAWRPFNDINEFNARFVLAARYVNQTFWMKSTTDPTKASLWALDTAKNPYNVLSTVDLSNYYTKTETNNLLALKANITYVDGLFDELSADLVEEIEERIAGDLNLVQKKPKLIGVDGFYYPDGYLSLDGTKILNNYDRFNGTPFNVTKVTTWFDGTTMNDSKVDNIIYFKNPVSLGGGYSKRDYDGGVDAKWFGAKGDGIADDTSALNLFASYIMSHKCGSAIMVGTFRITSKIYFIATNPLETLFSACRIICDFDAEDEAVLFKDWEGNISGNITIVGGGSVTWASRRNGILLKINNCNKINFNKIYCLYAKYWGVSIDGNSYLCGADEVLTRYCGSAITGSAGKSVTTTASIQSGGTNSPDQRSTLTLSELPVGVTTDTFIRLNGRDHKVYSIDTLNNKISVYPWIDTTTVFPAAMDLYMGGGVKIIGGDSGQNKFGRIDAFVCGIGLLDQTLYPASVDVLITQSCGIGHVLGYNTGSGAVGGYIGYSYYETNNTDFIVATLYGATGVNSTGYIIGTTTNINFTKVKRLAPYLNDNTPSPQYYNLRGISIGVNGINLESSNDSDFAYSEIPISAIPPATYNLYRNTQILDLTDTPDLRRIFGYQALNIFATGTGANGQPTGSYTFKPETGYTINSGAVDTNLVVSGMTGATWFYVRLNGKNWTIYWTDISTRQLILNNGNLSGRSTSGSGFAESLSLIGLTILGGKVYNATQIGTLGSNTCAISANNVSGGKLSSSLVSSTGAIKIQLPTNANSFYTIKGIIRSAECVADFTITGLGADLSLETPKAVITSSTLTNLTVRWFNDGTTPYFTIGGLAQSWRYLSVAITSVVNASVGATIANTCEGWVISLITSFTGTQVGIYTPPTPNNSITNTTTTALSSSTLNTLYPDFLPGYRVICPLITGAPVIYTKATENGSSDVWLTTTATVTP